MSAMETKSSKRTPEVLVDVLRKACLKRKVNGIKSIGRAFRLCDDNGDGTLTYEEFKFGIKDCQVDFSEDEYRLLFATFDRNNDGAINYNEFIRSLRPPMSPGRVDCVNKAYNKFDANQDGKVTCADIKMKYDHKEHPKFKSGEWTAGQVFNEFMKSFEPDDSQTRGDGEISYDEFLDYYSGVSASIDKDVYFDFMMRQAWKYK